MKLTARGSQVLAYWTAVCLMLLLSWNAHGQSCQTASEIDAANKTAIQTTAQRYFDMASKGDAASLRQNAIASLASDFTGIEGTIKENQANLSGAQATIKSYFLLDASGAAPIPNAEFYCGVFGKTGQTANSCRFLPEQSATGKICGRYFGRDLVCRSNHVLGNTATVGNRLETGRPVY